jgi:hypothetical protein
MLAASKQTQLVDLESKLGVLVMDNQRLMLKGATSRYPRR